MNASASDLLVPVMHADCWEFIAPTSALDPLGGHLPVTPGEVRFDVRGRPLALYVAPRRWLVPGPADALRLHLQELQSRGLGAVADVDGKWQWLRTEGPAGLRLLESTIDVGETLNARDCASTTLFDCPAVVAHRRQVFDLWIAASYFDSFLAAARVADIR